MYLSITVVICDRIGLVATIFFTLCLGEWLVTNIHSFIQKYTIRKVVGK